jgi:hypothetical protein
MNKLSKPEQVMVQQTLELSNQLSQKLVLLSVVSPESSGNIAHHLAEVCLSSRTVNDEIVPRILSTSPSDSEALAELSHDLLTELQEIRDSIDAMSPDITALMNALNK